MKGKWKTILKEILRGKSLVRVLTNLECEKIVLSGSGVELGAKDGQSSHFRFFQMEKSTQVAFTDLTPKAPNVLRINLEERFPLPGESQDFALLIHVLEHLFDYRTCLFETNRILKPRGMLVGCVPFLYRIHPDPDDYFRFSESCLRRILKEAGFAEVTVTPLGFGPVTAGAFQYARILKIKILVFLAYVIGFWIDTVLARIFPKNENVNPKNFPLGYFFVAYK
jgi:SAM-dependent methyltransferase